MTRYLNDSELAVVIDSLHHMKGHLQGEGRPSPNVQSALRKIAGGVTPWTYGLKIEYTTPDDDIPESDYARWD